MIKSADALVAGGVFLVSAIIIYPVFREVAVIMALIAFGLGFVALENWPEKW